jgi:hypothetical protein
LNLPLASFFAAGIGILPRARQLVRDIEGAAQIGLVGGGVLNTTTGG